MKTECQFCRYWIRSDSGLTPRWGFCRRYAPHTNTGVDAIRFPSTRENDWCGEFETRDVQPEPQFDAEEVETAILRLKSHIINLRKLSICVNRISADAETDLALYQIGQLLTALHINE